LSKLVNTLEFLTNAKMWYVDASFKVIKQPFTQLFSIHAFAKKDGELMQTPLAVVIMSCRRRKDYTSACSMLLSPRFHVDHAYKPLCPTLKRLCGQEKSCREFAARLRVPLLAGCLSKHPSSRSTVRVHVRRAHHPCVSSNDGLAISTCRRHCRRVPDLAYCIRRPAGCTASAVHGAPVDQLHHLAAYYLVSLPSAGADQVTANSTYTS